MLTKFSYNNQTIARREDGFVNANQMCQAVGKRLDNFMRLAKTKEYIVKLKRTLGVKIKDTVQGGNPKNQGTWVHPLLAEELARWLDRKNSKPVVGTIYVLLDNGNNAYKVGFTGNLKRRIKSHLISHPFLELVKIYENKTVDDEQLIHSKLSKYRIKKTQEWYKKHPDVLKVLNLVLQNVR